MLPGILLALLCLLSGCDLSGVFSSGAQPTPGTKTASTTYGPPTGSHLTNYVNPFIGTAPGGSHFGFSGDSGDTFPGASYPLGMVQWSPDTISNLPGGYYSPDVVLKGLSLTHFSGRGCLAYQDFPFIPFVGDITASPALASSLYNSTFSHTSEHARPGYYSVHLDGPNVTAELSVTPHTGLGTFTYPASKQSTMLINASGSINGTRNAGVTITPGVNQVTGFATSTVGCGSNPYTIYFAAHFDRHFTDAGIWEEATVKHGATSSTGKATGAFLTFDTSKHQAVHVQVGISFVSIANAQANLAAEDAHFDLAKTRARADAAWNARLSTIQVQGGTTDEKVNFYSALYHSFLHPNIFNDANGQYIGFDGQVHSVPHGHNQYENIAGWDQYRSLVRLQAILAPAESSDIAQSLVNDAQQGDGHLPRWEQTNVDSHGMNGDGGSLVVAEQYAFGARDFDTVGALAAMINGQPLLREALTDYLSLGYVAASSAGNSADITLEYANADFATAMFAQALGKTEEYRTFLRRSNNWQNLFNRASGYIQPRHSDGSWSANFRPTDQNGFQEGDAAQYSWMVPFNLRALFNDIGGKAGDSAVVQRLDTFFTALNAGPESQYAFMGNEPCFEVPWEYDFAGAPSHTQSVVRRIQTELFHNATGGLPGNDDGGSMSSWYVFSAIGLYPEITGIGGFVIGSPLFTSITIQLAGGHRLHITAPTATGTSPYVQSLQFNGKATTSLWLPWSEVQSGATLDFKLGQTPSSWGNRPEDAPPSYPPPA